MCEVNGGTKYVNGQKSATWSGAWIFFFLGPTLGPTLCPTLGPILGSTASCTSPYTPCTLHFPPSHSVSCGGVFQAELALQDFTRRVGGWTIEEDRDLLIAHWQDCPHRSIEIDSQKNRESGGIPTGGSRWTSCADRKTPKSVFSAVCVHGVSGREGPPGGPSCERAAFPPLLFLVVLQ